MICYNRTDISEGTDPAKSNDSNESMVCHYWLFNNGFGFQDYVCNCCHDLTILCLNVSHMAIITVKIVVLFMTRVRSRTALLSKME